MAQDDPVFKPVGRVAQPAKENDAAADVVREFRVRPCWIRARSRLRLAGDADPSRIVAGALCWSPSGDAKSGNGPRPAHQDAMFRSEPFLQVEAWAA
jgi:hypothetical protein